MSETGSSDLTSSNKGGFKQYAFIFLVFCLTYPLVGWLSAIGIWGLSNSLSFSCDYFVVVHGIFAFYVEAIIPACLMGLVVVAICWKSTWARTDLVFAAACITAIGYGILGYYGSGADAGDGQGPLLGSGDVIFFTGILAAIHVVSTMGARWLAKYFFGIFKS